MIKYKYLCFYALLFSPLAIPASSSALFNGLEAVSDEDRKIMVDIAKAVKRVKRNPFLRDDVRESTDSDLREKESATTDDEEAEQTSSSSSSSSKSGVFSGSSNDYCDKFEQHFSFYCVGEVDQSGKNDYVLKKFCPSYKKACAHKTITSSVSLTSWPTDPFEKKITVTSRPVPSETLGRRPSSSKHRSSLEELEEEGSEEFNSKEDEEIYYAELRKRYPCKPDCDRRIFAHCTEECKCDYIYPMVQRFCNPPPLPLFLNTCRLWYHGCPKYERYHYSSQFVYSKAEKGKVLPGSPEQNPGNPYNAAATAPFRRHRAMALAPIHRRQKRSDGEDEEEELELIIPPPVPKPAKLSDLKSVSIVENKDVPADTVEEKEKNGNEQMAVPQQSVLQSRAILQNYQKSLEKKQRRSRRKKLRRRRHHRQRYDMDDKRGDYSRKTTTARPPTPVELWRALKKINSITSGPGSFSLTQSPASLKGGRSASPGGIDGFLESISQESQQKQQSQSGDVANQWAGIDPRQFTKDIVSAATEPQEGNEAEKKSEEPDFSKLKPRTLSPGPTTEVREPSKGDISAAGEAPSRKSVSSGKAKAFQGSIPILPSDASIGAGTGDDTFKAFDGLSDSRGVVHTPRSRSPFTKPGLWEPNPADPHSRDPANKYYYHPESVGVDWLNGQIQWGGHWAVPAAGVGGTAGMSAIHFPTIGSFLNIPDDYD